MSENEATVMNMDSTSLNFSPRQFGTLLVGFALILLWFARLEFRTFTNENNVKSIKEERVVEKITHQKDRELIIRIDTTVQRMSKQLDKLEK